MAGRTAIYRLYDAEERLLYVGISMAPERRWEEHALQKLWWHLVARKEVEWVGSRVEALAAEEAIERSEKPRFGDTHRFGGMRERPARRDAPELKQGVADVADRLRKSLHAGEYQPGERLPAVRALADLYGVSIAMVRSALEDLYSERVLDQRTSGFWVAGQPSRPS
jgi:predicted GIY-YIG superfamily endonuclease